MFPLEKYKHYVNEEEGLVVAVQTFAHRKYSGIARCAKSDTFDVEKGKRIAALKCNKKIASARLKYATREFENATRWAKEAEDLRKKLAIYYLLSEDEYDEAVEELDKCIKES